MAIIGEYTVRAGRYWWKELDREKPLDKERERFLQVTALIEKEKARECYRHSAGGVQPTRAIRELQDQSR